VEVVVVVVVAVAAVMVAVATPGVPPFKKGAGTALK